MNFAKILVTGGAGFIGSHLVDRLLADGKTVLTVDNFNDYYALALKRENVRQQLCHPFFRLVEQDITNNEAFQKTVGDFRPEVIVHLAARAGVRPSLTEVGLYERTNVNGTINVLEAARSAGVRKLIFGSSSSVYGLNTTTPFSEDHALLKPASPYAATKIAGEALCYTYHHLYGLPITALRFFTVYGPRQRPDLAIRKFAEKITRGEEIVLYGDGSSARDYTYVDDIVDGILRAIDHTAGYEIFNLGNSRPVSLSDLVAAIETAVGRRAIIRRIGDQPGDVPITFADISRAQTELGYHPAWTLEKGLAAFVEWLGKGDHREEIC